MNPAPALSCALLACLGCWIAVTQAQTCTVCGVVRSVREVSKSTAAERITARTMNQFGTQSALDTDPVVGTVARFEFDQGRPESWHLGAAGTPDMRDRLDGYYYEVTVRMDDGDMRTLQRRDGNRFYVGQRVALRSGELEPM